MHGYKQLEHTADIAIEIYADSIVNLFHAGLDAWLDLSLSGTEYNPSIVLKIELAGNTYEELLVEFLGEINFQLHVNKMLFSQINHILLSENKGKYFLNSEIAGEEIDFDKFYIKEEIKAVTFHQAEIIEQNNLLITKVVFDI